MTEIGSNFLLNFEHRRDAYGFAVRPQHLQRFREYADIYREEEEERSDKWSKFLEQQAESGQPSPLEEQSEELLAKATVSEKNVGDDSSEQRSITDDSIQCDIGKEVPVAKGTNTSKVQTWAQIRPTLGAIGNMMSFRLKKRKNMNVEQLITSPNHLPSVEETRQPEEMSEEDFEDSSGRSETLDDRVTASRVASDDGDGVSPELFFPWKEELESLVHGGVPKALRGEVWQAFVGVSTRRVDGYYQDLLAPETNIGDNKEHSNSCTVPVKLQKQIEKDLPRTFPGHPALNENGRDSMRRVLLAYAQHNPSVGYCQAMNFFAGLLLLMMPEENAFWTLVGIIDDYFDGYFSEEMIESQVDQLVFEELMRERFPKLVNHLDYLGVQVAWISGPWFLSIFVNMLPWESVLRVWDVLLFEGNRVMLFRTALALMDLYGPALVTTKDAGDAISLLQSLTGSTFDSSQLVFTACMGFLAITEDRLQELRKKHRPAVLEVVEERSRGIEGWKNSKGLASKLYSFKHPPGSLIEVTNRPQDFDGIQDGGVSPLESHFNNLDEFLTDPTVNPEVESVPDLQEQVDWMKVELCRLLEEKRSATLRAEELETALMEMVKQDNRRQLSARVEQLEQEIAELRQALADKKEQEHAMLQVLMRVEQEQRVTEDARRSAEQDAAAQRYAVHVLQEKYEKAMASLAQMEKRVVMAESMLEATLQYESGQVKAQNSPRSARQGSSQETRKIGLLSMPFRLGWDRNKGNNESKPIINEGLESSTLQKGTDDQKD